MGWSGHCWPDRHRQNRLGTGLGKIGFEAGQRGRGIAGQAVGLAAFVLDAANLAVDIGKALGGGLGLRR